ncbi:MAG: hypothetical protein ABSE67_19875 [Xanthobacteraceae bacterium]|jgi:hypothetical protein
MSDIGLNWGPLDFAAIGLIIGSPGLLLGAAMGAIIWRSRRLSGALVGALVGLLLWLAGFGLWKMSPWG